MLTFATYKRYPDNCYAVVCNGRRGPCGNSKRTAYTRWLKSGFIGSARTDKSR